MDKALLFVALLLVSVRAASQIATLYAQDPVARTLSFITGQYGLVMQGNGVYNFDSQIDYSWYNQGALTVGIQGNEQGVIVDLGTQDALATEYSYYETVGKGQGFASIQFQSANSNQLMIRTQMGGLQPLNESSQLANVASQAYWVPVVDHVALVKVEDGTSQTVVKMLVLAVNSDYVTFRHEILRSNVTANPTAASDPYIKTLYAYDPTMRTLSFSTGLPGLCFCGYTSECDYCAVCNCYSDLDYNWYALNALSSGIEGGRLATWVDLGTETDLENTYPNAYYPFPSIRFSTNTSQILQFGDAGSIYTLNARNETTNLYQNGTSSASQSITVGNYYLVRITDSYSLTFERVVLLKVLHHSPSVGVTIRYQTLRDTDPSTIFPDNAGNRTYVTTLYAKDPITHSYDLDFNRGGAEFNSGGVYNLNSMIEFDNYLQGGISSGVQGGQLAVLLDIGTETAIVASYLPAQLRDPWTEIFYNRTLRSLYYLTPTANYNLNENPIFFAPATSSGYVSLNAYGQHVYLLRLYDSYDPTFERIYKLLVLKYVPNEELTIRVLWLDRDEPFIPPSTTGITSGSITSGSASGSATTSVLSVTTADLNATLAASSSDASVIELCFMLILLIALLA